jgi:hypothetical protein
LAYAGRESVGCDKMPPNQCKFVYALVCAALVLGARRRCYRVHIATNLGADERRHAEQRLISVIRFTLSSSDA